MKVCTKCGSSHPATTEFFRPFKRGRGGLHPSCRACTRVYDRSLYDIAKPDAPGRRRTAEERKALAEQGFKACTRCHEVLALTRDNFGRNAHGTLGFQSRCRRCVSQTEKTTRKDHPERSANKSRRYNLWYGYGVTPEWYDTQLALQGGGCEICHAKAPGGVSDKFHVDHRHVEGWDDLTPEERRPFVRALLCHRCNTSLPGTAEEADTHAAYIRRYEIVSVPFAI